jgi:hypothetical protein
LVALSPGGPGSGRINSANSARAILCSDKKKNRDNVVHFQDFMTWSMRKNASPFGFALKHPSIEPMTAKRGPSCFCHWSIYLNASMQTEYAELMGPEPKGQKTGFPWVSIACLGGKVNLFQRCANSRISV